MNAVLFYKPPSFRLTGSLINAIEYFLQAVEYNSDLNLVLVIGTKSTKTKSTKLFLNEIKNIMIEKYILDHHVCKLVDSNIICASKFELPSLKFDTVLVLDYVTIKNTKGILNAKKILVISEKYTELSDYFYDKSLYNVTYYGEMPFHYKDIPYKMKCYFNNYRDLKNVQTGTYVNTPNNENYLKVQDTFPDLPRPMYFKSKTKPMNNMFEWFTHYLYYHADMWFDPHPRLFLECKFYNKQIIYHNPYEVKDGSWYRYHDIIENGLLDRYLTKDDEIIRELI